ncbi:uncharacterized protein LOC124274229 [Haliotis rubra]|uniref:uncharacterized protein LOC124274229 n=1 Tax=Haliotis rubra TaxID=36100 RepID=UPI001EE55846|nr:uncharacterized protein LOC124274229 [Haliotis rubra]
MEPIIFRATMDVKGLLLLTLLAGMVAAEPRYSGRKFVASLFPISKTTTPDTVTGVLFITHTRPGTCSVINVDGTAHHVQLQRNVTVTKFNLQSKFVTFGAYTQMRAIDVECSADSQLYLLLRGHTNGGSVAFPVLPVDSLSARYLVPSVPNNALLGVVAVTDNTTVTIQLNTSRSCALTFKGTTYTRGSQFTVVLQKRVVLQLARPEMKSQMHCDFGGSVVQSSKPVAVFSGSPSLNFPQDTNNADAVMSQIPPIESWGKTFFVRPIGYRDGSVLRVLAAYNHTTVVVDSGVYGVRTTQLDEGQFYDAPYMRGGDLYYINSSMPILVLQMVGVFKQYSVYTSIVPAVETYGVEYVIPDIQTSDMEYGCHVSIDTSPACTSSINIDATWTTFSRHSHRISTADIIAPHNTTAIRSTTNACPFAVHITGYGSREMFGFFAMTDVQDTVVSDSLKVACTPERWFVTLDTKKLALGNPVPITKNIFMSNTYCPGSLDGDVLVFNFTYNDCNTETKTGSSLMTFSNYLTEYERDPETNLVTGSKWRYNIYCDLAQGETDVINFVPIKPIVPTVQTAGNTEQQATVITFYSDSSFENEIIGNPLKVDLASSVYVQVAMKDVPDAKLLVDNCNVSANKGADNSTAVRLLQNRCEANDFTHVIGRVDKLTRFYFDASQLKSHYDNIYVSCNVTFCSLTDFSLKCQNRCQMKSR